MISEATLARAVETGILTADQLARLRALAAGERAAAPPEDDEKIRLISGFADIFVTIGLGLFLGALGYLAWGVVEGSPRNLIAPFAAVAAVAWLLAEFFTRKRRMALPSIALLAAFAGCGFGALLAGFSATFVDPKGPEYMFAVAMLASALLTAGLSALHYRRFRVPITIAAGVGALVAAFMALLLAIAPDVVRAYANWLVLPLGVAVFALAMRFDMKDPMRETRNTDISFWLHMLAAPMIVHPLVYAVMGDDWNMSASKAATILAVFLALSAIAVLVDRRAILVSGLVYAGTAFFHLVGFTGISAVGVPITLLTLGAFILLLSAGWRPLRAVILSLMPQRLSARLPHPIYPA